MDEVDTELFTKVPKTAEVIAFEAVNGEIPEAGSTYIDPDAIGANPTAKIYPDGSIVGSTDNGSYTKYANGDLDLYSSGHDQIIGDATTHHASGTAFEIEVAHDSITIVEGTSTLVYVHDLGVSTRSGYLASKFSEPSATNYRVMVEDGGNFTYVRIAYFFRGKWK